MIKPDWNVFKAKFSENPQRSFEWFCYLLFCKEFDKPHGIFRYVNQSGMETNPIKFGNECVAWEAKFYEDKLSDHKDEFIKKLKIAKKRNPEISKLYFYTPLDWTENSKTVKRKTKTQDEIEISARDEKIEIIWRGASFFESPFVSIQNETIAKHFFSLDKNIVNLIKTQQMHSENIISGIQTYITFRDQVIEIDRSNELDRLQSDSEKILILSGPGGVGKTSIIKNLYENLKEKTPFYIFKATDFEIRNIQDLFRDVSLQEFIEAHIDDKDKIIVIDSAEKLLDLKNTDSVKEFLTILIQKNWKIIFTTRDNYLEDLNFQFFEIYKIIPLNINIQNLGLSELEVISDQYGFSLPKDGKLLDLIKNPFYLNEYLKFYKEDEQLDYTNFRRTLWNKIITKSKPSREQCFLKMAFERANKGQFFVTPDCETRILDNELKNDGILGYESPYGYFITHDIYEEWALEKIIEVKFVNRTSNQELFENIGHSLPIRRSFRNWVSEQLLLGETSIKEFIEEIIEDEEIESFWKDEIIVSILLSDYSDFFFENSKDKLLINNQELLRKSILLLRIACKEVDEELIKQLEIKDLNLFSLKYVLTKPKGQGWKSLIKFIFENLNNIGIENICFVLPVIYDWNSKFKEGTTTRLSSLIALHYHQWAIKKDIYLSNDDTDRLLKTILYGSLEIKNELIGIFDEIIKNQWKHYNDPYYDLSKMILTTFEGINVCKVLPEKILQIATLFWLYTPAQEDFFNYSGIGVDQYFGIKKNNFDYFPASSYQTPIYWLLQVSSKKTIDFILDFTNKTVEFYAKSNLDKDVGKVEVFLEKSSSLEQYISDRLWNMYRGTQVVVPHVLESIHAALEKFLLEIGKHVDSVTLENMLFYLIRNSRSASISAVVASIVLAYPEKTFNIAIILFKTKEFFLYDASRLAFDQGHKNSLLLLRNSVGIDTKNKIHEDERLETCDAKHRKLALENLFLNYQLFKREETSEKETEKRKTILWQILDDYYKRLPNESEETESDKTWRLFLARMDSRKINPVAEETDDGVLIYLNPEIEPELKEYSEKSLEQSIEPMKYSSLKFWAQCKMKNDGEYNKYEKYENDPKLAFKEAKKIYEDGHFYLFSDSIPADVCSVLVRDYFEKLSIEEKNFCKNIILEAASLPFRKGYQYQVSDGTQSAISVLPVLLNEFPEEKESVKAVLLLNLFNDHSINMVGDGFNVFSIITVQKLWENNFDDAQSMLFGYLILKPKYNEIKENLIKNNYKDLSQRSENAVITKFLENEYDLQKILNNELSFEDLKDIKQLDLYILNIAFQLIPLKTNNKEHKEIVKEIISAFAEKLMSKDRDNEIDYNIRYAFLRKYAFFVLSSPKEEIENYLKPFLDNFNSSEAIADLFEEFISAEDSLNKYECFWEVWNMFNPKVIELCKNGDENWYINKIIKSYLFAQNSWKTNSELKALKNENKNFFREISKKIGYCPSVLYAISKLLNSIGSSYLNEGVSWISSILKNNKKLLDTKLETDTIYYLENLSKIYIYKNRENIKKTTKLKQEILIILDFLIKKESVVGHMLRETII
ncbi:AVAST type 4 anti-phage nuclease Avs4 [Methanosarcina sp. UBA289]|uniref:AVAST type 4 anti-phage nuclease Avs4 n=1 Tax=Methanosarcina sp. UBA289 TaxID=1915574 RepID=UPI0025E33877|nr:AVAST type 4 anti-phage nuclease Avs4 [Methanosarcina sp. UBA289]